MPTPIWTAAEEQRQAAWLRRENALIRLRTGEGGQDVYIYNPGMMDLHDPKMIRGDVISRGERVVIVNSDVDPQHKFVWIIDSEGNEQSVYRTALVRENYYEPTRPYGGRRPVRVRGHRRSY